MDEGRTLRSLRLTAQKFAEFHEAREKVACWGLGRKLKFMIEVHWCKVGVLRFECVHGPWWCGAEFGLGWFYL